MKKILLLEDDLSLSDGLTFALKKHGYDVSAKRTVAEAKSAWNGSVFDLLILDVSLPDGSGFDFCKSVRQSSDVPVIFLTIAAVLLIYAILIQILSGEFSLPVLILYTHTSTGFYTRRKNTNNFDFFSCF